MKATYEENNQKMQSGLYKSTHTGNIYLYTAPSNHGTLVFTTGRGELGAEYPGFSEEHHMKPIKGKVTIEN